jgi:hypothetical protein
MFNFWLLVIYCLSLFSFLASFKFDSSKVVIKAVTSLFDIFLIFVHLRDELNRIKLETKHLESAVK